MVLICALINTNASLADTADMEFLTSIKRTQYHLHQSPSLKHDYHVYVLSPKSPDSEPAEKYPTVYLLDGDVTYPMLAAHYHLLSVAEDIPKIIIVGISYGADDYREGNKRSTDFTAPAKSRDHYGGAAKFQAMLRDELMPMIERRYPSDPERRILFGQSIGGQFAIYNAMTAPTLFYGLIASNPALHRNLDFFLEHKTKLSDAANKTRLFISRAENDDQRFKEPAQKWIDYWQQQDPKPFDLKVHNLPGHNHFSATPNAFRNGLLWMFK